MALCSITPIEFVDNDKEKFVTFRLPDDYIICVELSYLQFDLVIDGDYEGCFLKHARDLIRSYSLTDISGGMSVYYCPTTNAEIVSHLNDGPIIDSSKHVQVRIRFTDLLLFNGTSYIPPHDNVLELKVNLRDEFYKQNYTTGALCPGITTTKIKYSVKAPTLVYGFAGLGHNIPPEQLKYDIPVQKVRRIFVTPNENGYAELSYWAWQINAVIIKSERPITDVWHKNMEVVVKKRHRVLCYTEPQVDQINFRIHVKPSKQTLPVIFDIFNDSVIHLRKPRESCSDTSGSEDSFEDFADDECNFEEEDFEEDKCDECKEEEEPLEEEDFEEPLEEEDFEEEEESEPEPQSKKKVQPLFDKEAAEQALKIFNEVEKNLKSISQVLGKYMKN